MLLVQATTATSRQTTRVTTTTPTVHIADGWRTNVEYFPNQRPASSRRGSSRISPCVCIAIVDGAVTVGTAGGGDSCMSSSHYSWNLQLIANHVYQFNIKGSNGITLQHFISKFSDKWQLPQTSLLECTPTVECSPVVVPYVRTCFYNNYFTFRISCMNCIEYKKFFLSKYNSTFDC